jgi:hypothetical protein
MAGQSEIIELARFSAPETGFGAANILDTQEISPLDSPTQFGVGSRRSTVRAGVELIEK